MDEKRPNRATLIAIARRFREMDEKGSFGLRFVIRKGRGKATALYTCAPSGELAMAELELLAEIEAQRNPEKPLEAAFDVDPGWDIEDWAKSHGEDSRLWDHYWDIIRPRYQSLIQR